VDEPEIIDNFNAKPNLKKKIKKKA